MPLPHFSSVGASFGYGDPIYANIFDVIFSIDDGDKLSSSLTKMSHNYMFNENYDTKNNIYYPFEILNKYIDKPIGVKINFHQKDGSIMYYFIVHEFCFTGYSGFFDLDYSKSSDIRYTKVIYTCSGFEYFNDKDIKKVRMDKISEIFDERRSPQNIIKIENLFE
jgi:hypothetical protein